MSVILQQVSLSSAVDSRQDGPTVVQRWPQNSTLALLVALALTLVVVVGHNNQKQRWTRWPRDCAGPTGTHTGPLAPLLVQARALAGRPTIQPL